MPLYEYECQACAHRFEVIQKFSATPPSECPKCGGAVEKLVSSPAIQFKGSGFYLTDYGRGGKSDTAPGSNARSESGDKGDKADKADKADKPTSGESSGGDKGDKKDGSSAKSSESTGAASAGDSKPAAPATPKSDS